MAGEIAENPEKRLIWFGATMTAPGTLSAFAIDILILLGEVCCGFEASACGARIIAKKNSTCSMASFSSRLSRSAICLSQSLASCRGRIQIEAEFNVKRSIKLLDVIARDDDVIKKDTDVSRGVVLSYVLEMFDVRLVRSRDGDRCAECGNPKLILSSRI
jgi:hypothetical protein